MFFRMSQSCVWRCSRESKKLPSSDCCTWKESRAMGPRGQGVKGPRGQGAKGPRGQSKETVSDHLLFVDGFASDLWFICRILLDTYSEP